MAPSMAKTVQLCCLLWGGVIHGCAAELPQFNHTYNMQQSTIAMPCNYSGFMDLGGDLGKFGVIDFDW
jgi:hypothetical protein